MSYISLGEITRGVWETIFSFFTSVANNYINKVTGINGDLIPAFSHVLGSVVDLFQLVVPSVVYCFDAMLLSPITVTLMISVIIFKITGKFVVYWLKIVLDWWARIVP